MITTVKPLYNRVARLSTMNTILDQTPWLLIFTVNGAASYYTSEVLI